MRRAALPKGTAEGSSNCTSLLVLPPRILSACKDGRKHLLTYCNSLSPKSYVQPRSHRSPRPIEYSQPPQKTAQLWNKSKEDLASQLVELKSYVAEPEIQTEGSADGLQRVDRPEDC
jgi:hypothetical protein